MQVRMAQRTYLYRKEATVSSLRTRVSLLETPIEDMGGVVFSFSDAALRSDSLISNTGLTSRLSYVVQTCRGMMGHAADPVRCEDSEYSPQDKETLQRQLCAHSNTIESIFSHLDPNISRERQMATSHGGSSVSSGLFEHSASEPSDFIDRLHLACLYQGFFRPCRSVDPRQVFGQ